MPEKNKTEMDHIMTSKNELQIWPNFGEKKSAKGLPLWHIKHPKWHLGPKASKVSCCICLICHLQALNKYAPQKTNMDLK